jgi:hypothetical protein
MSFHHREQRARRPEWTKTCLRGENTFEFGLSVWRKIRVGDMNVA